LAPFVVRHTGGVVVAPPGCQVASAVGAAASTVSLIRKVDVVSLPDFSGFRAFLPDSLLDGPRLEEVISETISLMTANMNELAVLAGSKGDCLVAIDRQDREARLSDGTRMVMGASLTFRVTEIGHKELAASGHSPSAA
jgi:hypothetical protein